MVIFLHMVFLLIPHLYIIIKDSKASVLNTKYFTMLDEDLLLCCLNLSVCNFL